jgi:CheY-like chemotaxis protein
MSDQSASPRASVSNDDLFRALASHPRRLALFHLRANGAATFDELSDVVLEFSDSDLLVGDSDPTRARAKIETVLWEVELPLLEGVGLVVHDRIHDVVELAAVPEDFGEWLDLAVRREVRWANAHPSPATPRQRPVTVLVVDDEPHFADLIRHFLEKRHDDLSVITATNAPDAFGVLKELNVDCVVSDYQMPAISGLDFLEAVRDEYPDLPFILFTNKGSEEVASRAIANDVSGYVPKGTGPEQYDRLATQIRKAVGRT